jgi:hypothetical protein
MKPDENHDTEPPWIDYETVSNLKHGDGKLILGPKTSGSPLQNTHAAYVQNRLMWMDGPERNPKAGKDLMQGDTLLCIVENVTSGEQEMAAVVVGEGDVLYLAGTPDDWRWSFSAVSYYTKLLPWIMP